MGRVELFSREHKPTLPQEEPRILERTQNKMKLKEIPTIGMSREEWLEHRRNTIGGSDAAALLGLNRWSSPLSVYMDKKGITPDKPDNLAMRLGREFEDVVAKLFEEQTGKRGRRQQAH